MDYKELFEKHKSEFLKFDLIKDKKSKRRDLHAFLILDKFVPENEDIIIKYQGDDKIYVNISVKQIESLDEKTTIDLIRCGIYPMYSHILYFINEHSL